MRRLIITALVSALATGGVLLMEGKPYAHAACNAGGGNGSELGDPGNSELHNNAANVGNSQSAAALGDVGGEDNN